MIRRKSYTGRLGIHLPKLLQARWKRIVEFNGLHEAELLRTLILNRIQEDEAKLLKFPPPPPGSRSA